MRSIYLKRFDKENSLGIEKLGMGERSGNCNGSEKRGLIRIPHYICWRSALKYFKRRKHDEIEA